MAKLKEYHFSCGNSSSGPIGFCASVKAESRAAAAELLKKVIPEEIAVDPCGNESENAGIVYIEVYINEKFIVEKDIDMEDAVSE